MGSSDLQYLLSISALAVIAVAVIRHVGFKLANEHGTDIRIVWYLFSLTSVVTCILALGAHEVGAIDNRGMFQGSLGASINTLLKFMLNLDSDVKIFSAILAIVLLPQVISYFLSGLFGCASSPIFVGSAIRFFIWSVVKSLVVAAGLLFSLAFYGHFNDWSGWTVKGTVAMLCMSIFLLTLSFSMLYLYRDIDASFGTLMSDRFPKLQRGYALARKWLTRKMRTKEDRPSEEFGIKRNN